MRISKIFFIASLFLIIILIVNVAPHYLSEECQNYYCDNCLANATCGAQYITISCEGDSYSRCCDGVFFDMFGVFKVFGSAVILSVSGLLVFLLEGFLRRDEK